MLKRKAHSNLSSYIIAAIFAAITFVLSYTQWLLPFEQLLYDRLLRAQFDHPNQDVIIVAMDERSLQRFGPLPWARKHHAELINQLTKADVKAVGYDVLFDKKRGVDDQLLVDAVKNSGKLIFPVIIEKVSQNGELLELMPFPELIQASHNLGLVHYELGQDNIARSTYLRAGLGQAYWQSFSAEVLRLSLDGNYQLPFDKSDKEASYDLTQIEQEALVYLPFKQNSSHFKQISFVDLLDETPEALEAVKNKVVFVGVTATAARNADFLPVPVDRNGQIMSGVEINATLYEALKTRTYIQEMPLLLNAILLALVSFIFFTLLPKSLPRRSFYYGILSFIVLAMVAWIALHFWNTWIKVATILLVLISGYLVWIWRKMVANMNFFQSTVQRLSFEMRHSVQPSQQKNLNAKLQFLSQLELIDNNKYENLDLSSNGTIELNQKLSDLVAQDISEREKQLFYKLITYGDKEIDSQGTTYGVIEKRIQNLEGAIQQMNFLRRFIEQTLDRMSDAIILADVHGQIFYSNIIAKRYLPQLANEETKDFIQVLGSIKLQNNEGWPTQIRKVLQGGINSELTATINNVMDVKLNFSLLENVAERDFLILNMVNISEVKREQRRQLEMIDFISHDLRSPMTSILALLSKSQRSDSEVEFGELSAEIEKLTRTSLTLAEQFLMLSRAESNIDLAIYPVELLNAIDNAIGIVMPQAGNAKITLNFDFMAYQDIWLQANQDLLERVITNLLSNAIKYSPEGSQVFVEISQTDKATLLQVTDQGEGISQEQMEAIFKPFTRMQKHEVAKVKGIGLGLRFVRAAMMRFGGKVEVESGNDMGSTFTLEFPNHLLIKDE